MSTNNELIVIMKNGKFEVHENWCVDNDFKISKDNLLEICKTLKEAIKFCNQYMRENDVEYGYHISDSCLEDDYVIPSNKNKKTRQVYRRGRK